MRRRTGQYSPAVEAAPARAANRSAIVDEQHRGGGPGPRCRDGRLARRSNAAAARCAAARMSACRPTMSVVPSFDEIAWLRDNSPAWRLLRADNAPLVLSFLHRVFVTDNVRSISATQLASRLDDELYALNQRDSERGGRTFPKQAKAYLDDWAAAEAGWLRKYYPEGTDEPHYDATPAVEKALHWIQSLHEREFVGTESRLRVIFDLLRQIVFGTEADPEQRLAELRRQRQDIDEQIARVQAGDMPSSSRPPRGNCWLTSARWRRTSASWTGNSARRSPAGTAARASCSTTCWAAGSRSRAPPRESRSRRSTASCCPRRARKSCPACWTACTHSPGSPSATPAWGTSTTTGWMPPSAPRRPSASSPNSSAGSSTTRCGSRTAG